MQLSKQPLSNEPCVAPSGLLIRAAMRAGTFLLCSSCLFWSTVGTQTVLLALWRALVPRDHVRSNA